jgi:hypothetical protein
LQKNFQRNSDRQKQTGKITNMNNFQKWLMGLAILSTLLLMTAAHAQKDYQFATGEDATQSREQWQQLTAGEDLARDKKVAFFPPPNYSLTTDENDPLDLTDGRLSTRVDDRVWFQKDAVGWYYGVGTSGGITMLIDLGKMQPVGQIAIRVLAGREQSSLELPAAIEFLASADGREYSRLGKMVHLNEAEKEQADGVTRFYFPEVGKAYMVPLVWRGAVRARYISLRVTPRSSLFTDQISVTKAPENATFTSLNSLTKVKIYTDGLVVMPRHETLTVTTNIVTPNWLTILNNSGLDAAKEKLAFRLELPRGLRVLPQSHFKFEEIPSMRENTIAYQFAYDGTSRVGAIGPLWIEKDPTIKIPDGATARFTGILPGGDSHVIETPVKLVEIPKVSAPGNLDISLAWMEESDAQEWPNFLRDFRKMGFGYVSTFPRYFGKDNAGNWDAAAQKNLHFLQKARDAGYKIVYNESPFHVMWNTVQTQKKAGTLDVDEAPEMFTLIDGKPGKNMNILYRGKYYQNEIQRVAKLAGLVQPDQVYLDIEWWYPHVLESKKDPRVIAAWKASGKEWDDFVTDIGEKVLRDLVTAIRAAVPQKKLVVGLYNSDPTNKIYGDFFQFDKIYPSVIDIAQPSLYVQGRTTDVADRIRFDYDVMQSPNIIPWLTAGTYGEFDPKLMEPMVLEAILNGSRGLTYCWFGDFDPLDFYYHSKALETLAHYEKLLQTGRPIPYKGNNPSLHVTAFASKKEALILVGNYNGSPHTKIRLPLPFASVKKATLAGKNLPVKNGAVEIEVPPGEFRLIAVK